MAKHTYDGMQNAYDKLIVDVATNKKINIPQLKQAIVPMVDSVIRNPDALILLTRLKSIDAYAYLHAMSCAVLAVAMGRHIGLPKTMLQELALGAALFDIGRARINHELLTRPRRLSDDEMVEVRKHVDYAVEMVKRNGHISASAVHMIETHHERHDGSGYPEGLKGEEIPLFGRIAGIVDCYDAITTTRPHAKPVSPDEAIRLLYQWRDIDFQGAIIEQFIQVIGIYPVGTIVQLSDGRVGIVVAQHLEARLRPVVMVLMESDKQLLDDYYEFDMRKHTSGHNGQALSISHSLSPGSYGIDPAEYFI
ncbi:HD-GYP domain-containing protein [Candidatus Reidiella endopervernicosa]|uniref:HD-GYP domain-containing protein n=1 Tax=Candidatus Reidiella endopervernicosa TaxID=2738883 RepID=A0A6N0HSI8_9GAMM|nr:HD-GYP domain-containing protein [Candidatus Reidiella endopervernicosa]QKQ25369.1 HD-GYP domain-containing protein [Candidatus Reidiella endopervernicosa]